MDLLRSTKVPLGISLAFYGLVLTVLAFIPIAFAVPFVMYGKPILDSLNPMLLGLIMVGLGILLFVAFVLGLSGKVFCLTAPAEMRGKGAICLAAFLDLLAICIAVGGRMVVSPQVASDLQYFLMFVSLMCFLVFLRHLGDFMENHEFAKKASRLLILGAVLVLAVLLRRFCFSAVPVAAVLFGILPIILGLVGLVLYSRLLLGMKNALRIG